MNARKWLYTSTIFTEISGIAMVIGAIVPGSLDPMISVLFGEEIVLGTPARLGAGIAGAVLAGWASSLAILVRKIDELSPSIVGSATLTGVAVWFVLDAIVSVANGAILNLPGNVLYLLILAVPAWHIRVPAETSQLVRPKHG